MPGPTAAFFAPVAGVIGLMAGFWASRGVFQLRTDDVRVGGFLALAPGILGAAVAFLLVQATIGIPDLGGHRRGRAPRQPDAVRPAWHSASWRSASSSAGWPDGPSSPSRPDDPRIRPYLSGATAVAAFVLVFAIVRLLFGPTGYFSTVDGVLDDGTAGRLPRRREPDLAGLADPAGLIGALVFALLVAAGALAWARRGDNARLFPVWVGGLTTGLVAAMISAPIAAGVFGGVTGGGTDALVALFRTLGLSVFQSAFAQGLTSDPLDKTISYTIVFLILGALPITVRTMYSRGETTVAE